METYSITIKKVATATAFQSVADRLEAGEAIASVIKFDQKGAGWYAYLEGIKPALQLGKVTGLPEGEDLSNSDRYSVKLKNVDNTGTKPIIMGQLLLEGNAISAPVVGASYDEQRKRIVDGGIATDEAVSAAIQVMEQNNVHESLIEWTLSTWEKGKAHQTKLVYKNQKDDGEESFLTTAIIAHKIWAGLILTGPKSTGKNVFAETLAMVLHLPYYRINFTRDMLLEDVFGSKSTDNSAADGLAEELARAYLTVQTQPEKATDQDRKSAAKFEYLKAKSASVQIIHDKSVIMDWAKQGGVLMLDELNMADANMLQQIVNPITDTEKVLLVPGVGEIPLHRNCFVVAGMNPGYAGTMELNEATASRMGVLEFKYSGSIRETLLANFPGQDVPTKCLDACDSFYDRCKKMYDSGALSARSLNVRGFVHALSAYLAFPTATTLQRQLITYVVNGCESDERGKVLQVLQDLIPDKN